MVLMALLPHTANCGAPPNGSNLTMPTLEGPVDVSGDMVVANLGAVATYSCVDGLALMGEADLVCTDLDMTAVWEPGVPTCVPGKKQNNGLK